MRLRDRIVVPRTGRDLAVMLWVIAWLTGVWVLLWGSITWGNVIGGFLVSLAVLLVMPLPPIPAEGRVHPLSLLRLAGRIAVDLAKSSVEVAWLSCRPGRPPKTAILRADVSIKSDLVMGLLIDAINIVPGTIVLEIDRKAGVLYIHVLDVDTPAKVDRFYAMVAHLEHLFIRAFEREEDWQERAPIPPTRTPAPGPRRRRRLARQRRRIAGLVSDRIDDVPRDRPRSRGER